MYAIVRKNDGHILPPIFFERWRAEEHKLGMELATTSKYIILSYIDKRLVERYYGYNVCKFLY